LARATTVPPMAAVVPYTLQTELDAIKGEAAAEFADAEAVLRQAEARLVAQLEATVLFRTRANLQRTLADVRAALDRIQSGKAMAEVVATTDAFAARWFMCERQDRERRTREAQEADTTITRYLPMAGPVAMAAGNGGATGARNGPLSVAAMAVPSTDTNRAAVLAQEARYMFGRAPRPVNLLPFDMCPRCRVTMLNNPYTQQLVCPTTGCKHFKRFADMTSAALPFGEDYTYMKFTYDPNTHLKETIRNAEGAESAIVPASTLEQLMQELRRRGIRPCDLTIPLIRQVCDETKLVRAEHTVQVHARLSGRSPHRMTAFMKDKMSIMFHAMVVPYRRHCGARNNNLSFQYLMYKFCELEGYFEMLEPLSLLRAQVNLAHHDAIMVKVCEELGWQYIPTVTLGMGKAAAMAASSKLPQNKTPKRASAPRSQLRTQ
jgi:hypothetical protein